MKLNSDKYFNNKKVMDMFKVTQVDCPDMRVHINSGTILYNNQIVNFSEQYSDIITAPRIGAWIVVLSVNKNGELVYTYGVQSTEEKLIPTLPDSCFHLCAIEVGASDIYIVNDMISDLRQIFTYSENTAVTCTCKCALEDTNTFTEEDRQQLKSFYDKYADLELEIDKLKLLHEPQKEYRVLSTNGIEYIVRFHDDGTPYFTQVSIDDVIKDEEHETHENYKFVVHSPKVNVINDSRKDFINVAINVKSFDNINDNVNCTLYLRCPNTTIYNGNMQPYYAENEFKISNVNLTKSGFYEQFSLNFHQVGEHTLQMLLYKNETKTLIDSANVIYEVSYSNHANVCPCDCP